MRSFSERRPCAPLLAALCAALLTALGPSVSAQDPAKTPARLSAAQRDFGGVAYVSLSQLADQLGGTVLVANGGVEVSLEGVKAVALLNDPTVAAGQTRFPLSHPIVGEQGAAFVALEDAAVFFQRAFGVNVTLAGPAPAEAALLSPSSPVEAPLDEEDPAALLETVEPVAPPAPAPEETPPALEPLTPASAPETAPGASPETAPGQPAEAAPTVDAQPPAAGEPDRPAMEVVITGPVVSLVLDPGHGGSDAGSAGPGGLKEKDVTLALAQRMAAKFSELSQVPAALTRTEDRTLTAGERAVAQGVRPGALIVGVHIGASAAATPPVSVLYPPVRGEGGDADGLAARAGDLAAAFAASLLKAGLPAVARSAPLRLQTAAAVPCLLVECGSLATAGGEAALTDEAARAALADALATALAETLGEFNAREQTP